MSPNLLAIKIQVGEIYIIGKIKEKLTLDLMNDEYTDGINCPYEIPSGWQYKFDYNWYADSTLKFECTKKRQSDI